MNSKKDLPTISIITPTLNNEKIIEKFLLSLCSQDYPKKKLEIVIVDGGSKDNTLLICRKYKTVIINNPKVLAEPGVTLGMQKASGDILIILATDNIFLNKSALSIISKVYDNKNIFAAFPKHASTRKDTLFTKYINIFTDPFNHFVYGNAANARTFNKIYKTILHNPIYDIYDFNSSKIIPVLAFAQGFSVRKEFVKVRKDVMDDMEPVIDIIKSKKYIAFIHSLNLYHHTVQSASQYFKKQRWAVRNALQGRDYGINKRANRLTEWQRAKYYLFPFYSFSLIIPILRSFFGVFQDKELIWLFHPVITFITAMAIVLEFAKMRMGTIQKDIFRQ